MMAIALGEALAKLLGGLFVFLVVLGAIIVPLAAASALFGSNWGASAGSVVSGLLQCGIVGLVTRFPKIPGAVIVSLVCSQLIMLMVVLAPIGASIELIADRSTATWTGMAIGVGVLVFGHVARKIYLRGKTPQESAS